LFANGASLFSRKGNICKLIMTLVFKAEAVANKLTLQRLNGFDDVARARVGDVLPSLFRRCSVDKKLTLTAVAGVGAENGIGSHG